MIALKTSVLIAASLEIGAVLGGASEGNCKHLYEFGKNLGIAFQIQDDYLDAFGNPEKFGKEVGGDIKQNKKTFLMLHALEVATPAQQEKIAALIKENPTNKVLQTAYKHLQEIAVTTTRKKPLMELAEFLIEREH
jgi:geranylgeranyl diphosphate synthase type II